MLQKMRYIQIVGPKNDLRSVVDVLYHLGTVHLEDVTHCVSPKECVIRKVDKEKIIDFSAILIKLGGILSALPKIAVPDSDYGLLEEEARAKTHEDIADYANSLISDLENTTCSFSERKSEIIHLIESLERYQTIIKKIAPLESQLPVLRGYEISVILINREYERVIPLIDENLKKITKGYSELIQFDIDENTLAAITVFPKRLSHEVHNFIYTQNVNEVRMPDEYHGMPFSEIEVSIEKRKELSRKEIISIDNEFMLLSKRYFNKLLIVKQIIEDIIDEVTEYNKFGETIYTFIIMGFIPKKNMKKAKEILKLQYGDRVIFQAISVPHAKIEDIPTFFDNPRFVKPFEFFMQIVTPPNYHEIDPSPLFALFFPIFFGLMVGDIGYGIVILIFSLILYKFFIKSDWMRSISKILLISSIPTIFFGFLFGEFFGDLGENYNLIHPCTIGGITLNRIEIIVPLLVLCIGIGVFHVFLGLTIGIINASRALKWRHVVEKIGVIALLTGIIITITSLMNVIPSDFLYPGIILVIVAAPCIVYGGGVLGTIELMSTVGNILSYSRIMAIGMASVVLAVVANRLGGAIGIVIIGVIVTILLHSLNIILAMFSPSMHAMRLHIVEFFPKFYEGGGKKYHPFRKNTEEKE